MKQTTIILLLLFLAIIGCNKEKQEECYTLDGSYYTEDGAKVFFNFDDVERNMMAYLVVNNVIASILIEGSYEKRCKTLILPRGYTYELQLLEKNKENYKILSTDSIGKKAEFILYKRN